MQKKIAITFARELGSLEAIFTFLEKIGRSYHLADEFVYSIKLCIEELFVNMIRYQPHSKQPVTLEMELKKDKTILRLIDRDVDPFDVSQPRPVDTTVSLKKRKPGGLGIFFVHQLMDQVIYDYQHRTSTITLIKNL